MREIACKIILVVIMLGGVAYPTGLMAGEPVTVGFGSLNIGGIFQTTASWYEMDNSPWEFNLKRARILMSGVLIPEKVKFVAQGDAVVSPALLDSKLIFIGVPNLELTVGRFVPNFTHYMPMHTGKLDFINYPMTTTSYAMWRQTGIQATYSTQYVDVHAGIFNGYQFDETSAALKGNDWEDDNDAKDFLVRLDVKPCKSMKLALFNWAGKSYDAELDDDFTVNRLGATFTATINPFSFISEYVMGSTDYARNTEKTDSYAFMLQGIYTVTTPFEVLFRYDLYDGDTDRSDDGVSLYTAGMNYMIEKFYVKLHLNYIMKAEEGEDIDNDEIVAMIQYCF